MIHFLSVSFKATRPWSFTAAIIPVIITAALSRPSFHFQNLCVAIVMGIFIQAGANLTNTYYDYVNKIDTDDYGERTLFEGSLSPTFLVGMSTVCYAIATLSVLSVVEFTSDGQLITIFFVGILLAFFYTADPVGLKYHALGDVTVFLCFGPLLMQCTSLILIGKQSWDLNIYSIPIGFLTEAILHANNSRDIETDAKVGALTLAGILGLDWSRRMYNALLLGAYLSILYIAAYHRAGCVLCFLTIPMAIDLSHRFRRGCLVDLEQRTAQLHLPFGLLLMVGILCSRTGLF